VDIKIMTMHWFTPCPPYTTVHWFIVHSVDVATFSVSKPGQVPKKGNAFQKVPVTVQSATQEFINVLKEDCQKHL
jgi:hypothetical protein